MDLWTKKLAAFLHDPPEKCLDIAEHEARSEEYMIDANLQKKILDFQNLKVFEDTVSACDHFAAAADRFAFPKGKCATKFDGTRGSTFKHPLCSLEYTVAVKDAMQMADSCHAALQAAMGGMDTADAQKLFFNLWRRWYENAIGSNPNLEALAVFPADTRIPDHTIWNHITLCSALAPCVKGNDVRPTLLLFQMGPVQDFIAQARSTRDLWSGSYLISWLMAHAMKAIANEIGPDTIIFPNLRGNGIFDALCKDDMYNATYKNGNGSEDTLWERLKTDHKDDDGIAKWLLTPTLPNRFLAVVPEGKGEELAQKAEAAIRAELAAIGDAVWKWVAEQAKNAGESDANVKNWKNRWDAQLAAFPQIAWALQPWLNRDKCMMEFAKLPVNQERSKDDGMTPCERLQAYFDLAEKDLPDKDNRFFIGDKLNNSGILWSAHYALVDAKLAARRNTRDFDAWKDANAKGALKDSLSGKEEVIGSEMFWEYLHTQYEKIFTAGHHCYGAMNLIKRVWCRDDQVPYLRDKLGLSKDEFKDANRFDSVKDVSDENTHGGDYVAVIAMDGDEMGKWVSGAKTPEFLAQLSDAARQYLSPYTSKGPRRLLTPSYHLQFSEALANFAVWVARSVVEKHDGQLVYAGGDDVLAMLPADQAIACAKALKAFFRGEKPEVEHKPLDIIQSGFVKVGERIPLILPGEKCTVSMGMAIGHYKAPLQMLVKEAQAAEHRAKHAYGRDAIAFSIYKRSGEIIQWGCQWKSQALPLMETLTRLSGDKDKQEAHGLSARFPYALARLLAPYQLGKPSAISLADMAGIIKAELSVVIARQGSDLAPEQRTDLEAACKDWLADCAQSENGLGDFIQPFLTETFINRGAGEKERGEDKK